ncbi:unnamed protein product [Cercospora beticola]|nr:unnamed protein product [Cercospora beticola]
MRFQSLLFFGLAKFTLGRGSIPFGPKGRPDIHAQCCYEVVNHDPSTVCCLCNSDLYIGGHLTYNEGSNCPADNRACGPACTWNDTCCWRQDEQNGNAANCYCYGKWTAKTLLVHAAENCGPECPADYSP